MKLSKRLDSKIELVQPFIRTVIDNLQHESLSDDDIFHIKLVLEEALINAIKHGNKLHPQLFVDVSINASHDRLEIVITDQGEGFDPNKVPDPTQEAQLSKTSGRGVFLIKKVMDEVQYFDEGRSVRMVKKIKAK